jgi:hypothetical protein
LADGIFEEYWDCLAVNVLTLLSAFGKQMVDDDVLILLVAGDRY